MSEILEPRMVYITPNFEIKNKIFIGKSHFKPFHVAGKDGELYVNVKKLIIFTYQGYQQQNKKS